MVTAARLLKKALRRLGSRESGVPFWDLGDNVGAVRTRAGDLIFVDTRDESVGAALKRHGEWEPHIASTITRALRPGQVVVEVGSNIGTHVVTMSRLVGTSGNVIAIEANPLVADFLRATISINHLSNVTLIQKAVLDRAGHVELWASPENLGAGAVALPAWKDDPNLATWLHHAVEVVTLDDLCKDLHSVDLIHIDAEGCDLAILAGAEKLIARSPQVKIIAEWGAYHAPSYFDIAKGLDMLIEQQFEFWRIELDGRMTHQTRDEMLAREFCDVLIERQR